jgi:hypothetical protein
MGLVPAGSKQRAHGLGGRARIARVARTDSCCPTIWNTSASEGVHLRELCHPSARVEVRVFVDEPRKYWVCVA